MFPLSTVLGLSRGAVVSLGRFSRAHGLRPSGGDWASRTGNLRGGPDRLPKVAGGGRGDASGGRIASRRAECGGDLS